MWSVGLRLATLSFNFIRPGFGTSGQHTLGKNVVTCSSVIKVMNIDLILNVIFLHTENHKDIKLF